MNIFGVVRWFQWPVVMFQVWWFSLSMPKVKQVKK